MPGIVGGLLAKSGMTMAAEEAGWVSSGFFGALIAGFAAGLIMLGLKKILEKLPKALEGTKPMLLYPFLGIAAMGALMVFVVNPPVGAFNEWLNQVLASMGESSRVLLGAVLGGMVPPIGIALATLFFKNRFTKSEQQTVATNFIMGLSFITEGGNPVCSFRSAAYHSTVYRRFCSGRSAFHVVWLWKQSASRRYFRNRNH